MEAFLEILSQPWALRALYASIIVGVTCGVLGCFVVLRNMALIGDALSHAVLPGVVFGFILVGGMSLSAFFIGSVLAGLFAAVAITWIQNNVQTKNDAAIGIVFTAMFSLGVIGISKISEQDGVHLDMKDFLFGNVLGVSNNDLYLTLGVGVVVILSIIVFYRYLFATTFQSVIAETMGIKVQWVHYFLMLLLSFAVVAALRTVGVILVVAMLITPASTALLLTNRLPKVLLLSAFVGFLSAVLGLLLSIVYQTTPGPAMAMVATFIYVLAALFAPEKGVVQRAWRKRQERFKVYVEDMLKEAIKLQDNNRLNRPALQDKLGYSNVLFKKVFKQLVVKGYFESNPVDIKFTEQGLRASKKLVRAHRLWERYLVDKLGVSEEHIHQDAEEHEHYLTEDILDEIDAYLDYPETDPHGSPIPKK